MALLILFIILINIVTIALTYYCLGNMEKKEKLTFTIVGIAISYAGTSVAYWLSTKGIDVKEVSELGKNFITFSFVPINGILILPLLAKSYTKLKSGKLAQDKFNNRCILLFAVFVILLIIEFFYFKDIQLGIISMLQNS